MSDPTLQQWLDENWNENGANYSPDIENLYARRAGWNQVFFVRDYLARSLKADVTVVSTHRSKSLVLPVYRMTFDGVVLYMRENFHGWVVSVDTNYNTRVVSSTFAQMPKGSLMTGPDRPDSQYGRQFPPCYAEGFSDEWCFFPLEDSGIQFTTRISDNYALFMFCHLLKHTIR